MTDDARSRRIQQVLEKVLPISIDNLWYFRQWEVEAVVGTLLDRAESAEQHITALQAQIETGKEDLEAAEVQLQTLRAAQTALRELQTRWTRAELDMRLLDAGLPGSGYDKLADGYGTCADELSVVLLPAPPTEAQP